MKTQWKNRWVKVTIWVALEIILNLLGLDNLADYSEFIFEQEMAIATNQPQMIALVPPHYPSEHNIKSLFAYTNPHSNV
ncbi:MAG TPA: hypothetical protein V6D26_24620 [Stenomitos sp.]